MAEQRDSYLGSNPNPESRVLTLKLASRTPNSQHNQTGGQVSINKPGEDIRFHDDSTPECTVLWHWVYLQDCMAEALSISSKYTKKNV